jgi:hypothetical protein
LADLDQVAVRVTHVTADLGASILRFGEELRSGCSPRLIDRCDVRDSDVEEGAGALRIGRDLQRYVGLVLGRATPDIEDEPRVGDFMITGSRSSTVLAPSTCSYHRRDRS